MINNSNSKYIFMIIFYLKKYPARPTIYSSIPRRLFLFSKIFFVKMMELQNRNRNLKNVSKSHTFNIIHEFYDWKSILREVRMYNLAHN